MNSLKKKSLLILVLVLLMSVTSLLSNRVEAFFNPFFQVPATCRLTIEYQDFMGRKLIPSEIRTVTKNQTLKVTAKDIPGFTLASARETNVFLFGDNNTVIFRYVPAMPSYKIRFIDEAGKDIVSPVVKQAFLGVPIGEQPIGINGYQYIGGPNDGFFIMMDPNLNYVVNFRYKKLPAYVNYTIKYVDAESGAAISKDVIKKGIVGSKTQETAANIPGYIYAGGKEDGKILLGENSSSNNIVFKYVKEIKPVVGTITNIGKGNVGQELYRESIRVEKFIGEKVTVEAKDVKQFVLVDFPKKEIEFTGEQNRDLVEFNYHRISDNWINGTFLIRYVDKATGKDIIRPVAGDGLSGSSTVFEAEEISGYKLEGEPRISAVIKARDVIKVTFEYSKIK